MLHDQWDTLIPYAHSLNLASESGGMVQGAWFVKGSDADLDVLPYGYGHGDLQLKDGGGTQYSMPMYLTLSLAYLLKGIALPDQLIINGYDPDALDYFVAYLKAWKDIGTPMEWAAPRLLDLADDRVLLVNMDNPSEVKMGDDEVADAINAAWGGSTHRSPRPRSVTRWRTGCRRTNNKFFASPRETMSLPLSVILCVFASLREALLFTSPSETPHPRTPAHQT